MKLVLMTRRPRAGSNFSVELVVESIIENLDPEFQATVAVSRFESKGVFRRLYNVFEAALRQGEVNHVTGDVNFLTYLLARERTVLTVLDCGRILGAKGMRERIIRLLWFQIPVAGCAAITVSTHEVKRQLLAEVRVDEAKVHVIPVAVPAQYGPWPKPFNARRPVVLQVGTNPNKNLPRLFEALSGIPCHVRIVGKLSATYRLLLARFSIDYENGVNLTQAQMLSQYRECDIVAFVSTFEGFGMPIVEANRVGRPVVTGNVTSMPEVAGDAACLVDPFDVVAIRAGFRCVIDDAAYRERLVNNGFANARRFDAREIAGLYADLYRKVAGAAPRRQERAEGRELAVRRPQ